MRSDRTDFGQAIWYFFGCAVLIGIVSGLILHGILRIATSVFGLDRKSIPPSIPPTGHDAVSYRAARQAKKDKETRRAINARLLASQPLIHQVVKEARNGPSSPKPGLLQEVILEHTDEEDS